MSDSLSLRVTPHQLIAALSSLPGAFRLHDEGRTFVGALPVDRVAAIHPPEEIDGSYLPDDVPQWVGLLPYEAFRGWERLGRPGGEERAVPHVDRPLWQRYEAVGELEGERLELHGATTAAGRLLRRALEQHRSVNSIPEARLGWSAPKEEGRVHERRVSVALDWISQGRLYQVNLARRFDFTCEGHPVALLAALGPMAAAPFAAALDFGQVQVVSTSPELFLDHLPSGRVITRPIKGTRPRGSDPEEDERLRVELDRSEKERAELSMVIDIERNDLGRLCEPGSVVMTEAPRVISHPTVHHREATVQGQLLADVSRALLIETMMPSGSVTGAPKSAAMDLIARLEAHRRGLYTGALGTILAGGRMRLSMAIRVLTIKNGEAHYFAGGGIVADSDPAQELQETDWKAEQLRSLVQV